MRMACLFSGRNLSNLTNVLISAILIDANKVTESKQNSHPVYHLRNQNQSAVSNFHRFGSILFQWIELLITIPAVFWTRLKLNTHSIWYRIYKKKAGIFWWIQGKGWNQLFASSACGKTNKKPSIHYGMSAWQSIPKKMGCWASNIRCCCAFGLNLWARRQWGNQWLEGESSPNHFNRWRISTLILENDLIF